MSTSFPPPPPPRFGEFPDSTLPPAPPVQKSRISWAWLLVLFLGGGLGLLCCGGVGSLVFFGLGMVTAETEDLLRENPVLREQLGEVRSFRMDHFRSLSNQDEDIWVYQVEGEKGTGILTVDQFTNDEGDEEIRSARLRLSNGTELDLPVGPAAKSPDAVPPPTGQPE